MVKKIFLELYSEETPSLQQELGARSIFINIKKKISNNFKNNFESNYFFTSRRICIHFDDLLYVRKCLIKTIRGPNIKSSQKSIKSFKNKYKVQKNKLYKKKKYFYCDIIKKSSTTEQILKSIIEYTLKNISWNNSMRWGKNTIKWIRPIIRILCLLDKKILPIKLGHLNASNKTYGNWIIDNNLYKIKSYIDYLVLMYNQKIILSQTEKLKTIKKQVFRLIGKCNILTNDSNLKEIINLVESPIIAIGRIEEKFMYLPRDIVILTLKYHQKYLMLTNKRGFLLPYFIIITNSILKKELRNAVKNNERVLKTRLQDIEFFIDQDRKESLHSKLYKLKKLIFHNKIGDYLYLLNEIKKITTNLLTQEKKNITKYIYAINLIKNDLTTYMIQELPELQGFIGSYYASLENENRYIIRTIKDHYLPKSKKDTIPKNNLAIIISLSDKISTINLLFQAGIKYSGSKDPYTLRRVAISIIRIIKKNNIFSIKHLLSTKAFNFIKKRTINIY